jgi:phosphohistidine phosphatase SixA
MTFMRGVFALAVLASTSGTAAMAQATRPSDADIAAALKGGGHVIVIRHGATHQDQADTDPLNPANIAKQRQLNDKGRDAAKALGAAFKAIGVPVGKVYTSQFHRAFETAQLAGFAGIEKSPDVSEGGLVVTPIENNRRAAAMKKLAGTAPAPGTNTIIVSHKPNIMDAFGKDWFDVKEGEASIFKPEGTGYRLVARVQMDDWAKIATAAGK